MYCGEKEFSLLGERGGGGAEATAELVNAYPCGPEPPGGGLISILSGVDLNSEIGRNYRSGGSSLTTAFGVPRHTHRFASAGVLTSPFSFCAFVLIAAWAHVP